MISNVFCCFYKFYFLNISAVLTVIFCICKLLDLAVRSKRCFVGMHKKSAFHFCTATIFSKVFQ